IVDAPPRDDLEVANLRVGILPAVRLDEADEHVDALPTQHVSILEHGVGLPHAGCRPDVDAQSSPLLCLQSLEQLFRRRTLSRAHRAILTDSGRSTWLAYGLFMASLPRLFG